MTCDAIFTGAMNGGLSASQPRPALNAPSDRSEPASSTEHGPKLDGLQNIIRNRANRLVFNNDVQRQRFMEVHQTLSLHCCEGMS